MASKQMFVALIVVSLLLINFAGAMHPASLHSGRQGIHSSGKRMHPGMLHKTVGCAQFSVHNYDFSVRTINASTSMSCQTRDSYLKRTTYSAQNEMHIHVSVIPRR